LNRPQLRQLRDRRRQARPVPEREVAVGRALVGGHGSRRRPDAEGALCGDGRAEGWRVAGASQVNWKLYKITKKRLEL
jgi:hypothetical protein